MIQARSLTSMILTFKRLRQEDYCELLRPCVKEKGSEVKSKYSVCHVRASTQKVVSLYLPGPAHSYMCARWVWLSL